jgi:predicted AAA+ superfamily ATPase
MLEIDAQAVRRRLRLDNPWWDGESFDDPLRDWPRRAYFEPLLQLVQGPVRRGIILLGARRVGKTTLLRQLIGRISREEPAKPVLYASVDTPTYAGLGLEDFLRFFEEEQPHEGPAERLVVFDEVQYLPDWERHLKDLVDRYPRTRFIASGSAGAALKRKSTESGAGRFTDFELPPLTFPEFLDFMELTDEVFDLSEGRVLSLDPKRLDSLLVDYINFGGYPEVVRNQHVRSDLERFVRNDIVQKVLLQDLPTLYGITNIPELNKLFTTVAYNTGQILSLEDLSRNAGIAKPTISKYLEYLEAAFLIVRVRRVDDTARKLKRERNFKVFLTNPSMRAALFGPVSAKSEAMGALAETALLAQYLHAPLFRDICFARWKRGEIDFVRIDPGTQRPLWTIEVKWSDTAHESEKSWGPSKTFAARNDLDLMHMTSRTVMRGDSAATPARMVWPLPLLCFEVGRLAASQELLRSKYGLPPTPPQD